MGLAKIWNVLTAPWRLAASLDAYAEAQQGMLHEMMSVQRIQAETNAKMAVFLEQMVQSMTVDGVPEGRNGLTDQEELEMMAELQRVDAPPKWGSES